jgi:serine phosphatase RsbU (regulator of sigma subunit)
MARRGGPSLSVKMILTTTLLIVVTVVGSGVLNVMNIRRVFDDTTKRYVDLFTEQRKTAGLGAAPVFERTLEGLIAESGKDLDIKNLISDAVSKDTKTDEQSERDYGLRYVAVFDRQPKVISQCLEKDAGLACDLPPQHGDIKTMGPVTVAAWEKAAQEWGAATNDKTAPLVQFDIDVDGARLRMFAVSIDEPGVGRLGSLILGYDLAPLDRFDRRAREEKDEASKRDALYTGAVGALFALIGTLLAIFQGLSISRPIKQLAWKADQIARGDLEARVDIKTSDEIGFLGENFNFMADQITILLQQTAEKARIEQELEVARAIQETLVPGADPVHRNTLTFAGFYQPAAQTGGDWWTWSELVGNKVLLVIGDVTGHGVPSAMITAAAKAACDVARHVHGDDVTVSRLLEIMNHAIFESAQRRFVMTCFASIIDTRARTITYANAGHNFPYLFRAGTDGKGEFGSLMIRGNRLGDDPTSRYEVKTTELVPGDVIIWYTDGIVECENEAGEEYGEKRFRASVRRAAALDAGEMRDAIVGDAVGYFGEAPRKDDITMIVGRIH